MARKDRKRAARQPKAERIEEAPEVEEVEETAEPEAETPEVQEAPEVEEEEKEAEETPTESAPAAPVKVPKPERPGLFPGTKRAGGFEMRPQPTSELDMSPCSDIDEAIERVGGEEVVKKSRETLSHFVVIFGNNYRKVRFPKAK